MKILHINTERNWRGGERQTLFLLEGLSKRGMDVHLVCQPSSPLEERAEKSHVRIWPIGMRGEADVWAGCRLRRLIKRYKYDIVHSHTSHAHTLAYWATAGGSAVRLVTRRVEYSIYRNSFLRLNGIKYRHMADAYIAISERIKAVMIADGIPAAGVYVVPSGVITSAPDSASGRRLKSSLEIREGEPVILNVAHLSPEKGHATLLEAIARVASRLPAARLVVVGDGELKPRLQQMAHALGVGSRVFFAGFREDVADFYAFADVFVSSSTAEGLGTAALDALAAGLPVVATRVGGIPEFIEEGQTGRLVPPTDPQALAEGILDLLGDPLQARRMAAQGRELVQRRYSVERMIAGTIDVYERLLAGDGARTPFA